MQQIKGQAVLRETKQVNMGQLAAKVAEGCNSLHAVMWSCSKQETQAMFSKEQQCQHASVCSQGC
jgi:hypothetical protein